MSPKGSQSGSLKPRPRRRWWQRLLRAGVLAAVVLATAYATMPWWLPAEWVARRLAQGLSERLGVTVSVGRLDVSWGNGIELRDVRIDSGPEFDRAPMIRIGRLRTELSPLRLLLENTVQSAQVFDARLDLVLNENGTVNLAQLGRLSDGASSASAPPDLVHIHNAVLTIQLPRQERRLELDVSDLQYRSGRLDKLGHVSMSAQLPQDGAPASVTLAGSADGGKSAVAADCTFTFARLDLAQLGLPRLLGLPMSRLSGVSRGDLNCQIARDGKITDFTLDVKVDRLDAQPLQGPHLPTIDDAGIRLSMALDLLGDLPAFNVREFRVRLPGIDLAGKGRWVGVEVLPGWQDLRELQVDGTVNPATVLALAGAPASGRDATIDGDVGIRLSMSGDAERLSTHVELDAGRAVVRLGSRALKPAGRVLTAQFAGEIDKRTWDFAADADRCELRLGGNVFAGGGVLHNARHALMPAAPGAEQSLQAVLARLSGFNWSGTVHIADLPALRDFAGVPLLDSVRLDGAIEGSFSVRHAGSPAQVTTTLRLDVAPETRLSLDGAGQTPVLVKPANQALRLDFSCDVAPEELPRVDRFELSVRVGQGGLFIDRGSAELAVREGPAGAVLEVSAQGDYSLRHADELLACLPGRPGGVSGDATGHFDILAGPTRQYARLTANLTPLAVHLKDVLDKPADQPAEIVLDYSHDDALPSATRRRVALHVATASAVLDASTRLSVAADAATPAQVHARLRVTDAEGLIARLPAARQALERWGVRGAMSLDFTGQITGQDVSGQVAFDGDDLAFALPDGPGKARGVPMRLRVGGSLNARSAELDVFKLRLAGSELVARGSIVRASGEPVAPADPAASTQPAVHWPPEGIASVNLQLDGKVQVDSDWARLAPELARRFAPLNATGRVEFTGRLTGDAKELRYTGSFDAAQLAGRWVNDAPAAWLDQVVKPAGAATRGSLEVTLPPTLAHVHVRSLFIDTGLFHVNASGIWPLFSDENPSAHLAVVAANMERATTFVPALAKIKPSGSFVLDLDYVRRNGVGELKLATLTADQLSAELRGKTCRLNGSLSIERLPLSGPTRRVGRVLADGLEFAIGENHGFVIADVRDPVDLLADGAWVFARPTGQVRVLAEALDIYDLQQWAGDGAADISAPDSLTASELEDLDRLGQQCADRLRQLTSDSDFRLRLEAGRLKYFDAKVHAYYELQGLAADLTAKGEQFRVEYRCGLSGGVREQKLSVRFEPAGQEQKPPPVVAVRSSMQDVWASPNVMLQVAMEFPGNTIYGTISRQESLSYGLKELIMNVLESRYEPAATGSASLVAQDGTLHGRAAPEFISRMFPGLNLTSYRYKRMTGWTDYAKDGSSFSDLVFNGAAYDTYLTGSTGADRVGRYEMGAILLGSPQSPQFNHQWRQGRVPILKYKAQLFDGQFLDQEVTYPYPTETAYTILFQNNVLYRLWMDAAARRGAQKLTDEPPAGP